MLALILSILLLLNNCSFDNMSGIWSGEEDERIRVAELENEQNQIIDVTKIYSAKKIFFILFLITEVGWSRKLLK